MKKVGIGMKCMFLLICCTVCLMKFGISEVKAETYGDYEYFVHEDDTVSIEEYKGKDAVIKIPLQIDGMAVTQISEWAFSNCSNLTSVTIPSSIQNISDCAFDGCNNLASIIVDSKNSKYDSRNNCNAIIETSNNKLIYGCKNSIIPNDITSIGAFAFKDCISLTDITIPDGVTSIGYGAFSGCKGLTNITIPKSVSSIGYDDTVLFSKLKDTVFFRLNGVNTA